MLPISRTQPDRQSAPARKLVAGIALLPLMLLASFAAHGAASTTAVTPVQTLDFGKFVVLPTCVNCTVTISSSGTPRTSSPGIVLVSANQGRPAVYNVACSGNCNYTATMTGGPRIVAGVTMNIAAMTYAKSPSTGAGTLTVGATLTIPGPGATVGQYVSTSFLITTSP